jgi:hypothetical protein
VVPTGHEGQCDAGDSMIMLVPVRVNQIAPCRVPNRTVPSRTMVAPSSTATA